MSDTPYILEQINLDNNNVFVVVGKSEERVDKYLTEVERELTKAKFKGQVILDLLSSNGLRNRFFQIHFNKTKFDYSSIKAASDVNPLIRQVSASILSKHKPFLSNVFFDKTTKLLISRVLEKEAKCFSHE